MPLIEIEHLSKKYQIEHAHQPPAGASLKEILSQQVCYWLRKCTGHSVSQTASVTVEEFWALKDVTLNIEEGDRIALIGRNGAGKSTLLKLLSRITEPTSGTIRMRGRVSSLLEVGTGFHPDLTGRENIFLNGAILGMSYREIKRKFDEIVAFADVEKFLDTPIKRYSSGMFMRLGFAIAAHVESDLLIVDEVLAVGDMAFQEKCLKKMNEKGAEGQTILFVSHHISSVFALCNKGLFLEKGQLRAFEPIDTCVSLYLQSCPAAGWEWRGEAGDAAFRLYRLSLQLPSSNLGFYEQHEKTRLEIEFEVIHPRPDLILGFSLFNSCHQRLAHSLLSDHPLHQTILMKKGLHKSVFEMDLSLFHPGEYQIKLECSLLNRPSLLSEEILLKFAVYSQHSQIKKQERGRQNEGMSLGNRWEIPSPSF